MKIKYTKKEFSIFYLIRKKDVDFKKVKKFTNEIFFNKKKSNMYIILKGFSNSDKLPKFLKNFNKIYLKDEYFDLGSYYLASKNSNAKNFIFFNSNTIINYKGWFKVMTSAQKKYNLDLVGSSCSNETHAFSVPLYKNENIFFFFIKLVYRFFFRFKNSLKFKSYPNPHIRTNGFLVNRKKFNSFFSDNGLPLNKSDTYVIESGYNSLINYIKDKKKYAVVNKLGNIFFEKDFVKSKTFTNMSHKYNLFLDNQICELKSLSTKNYERVIHDIWRIK